MSVDEILADPAAALDLAEGNVPVHIVIVCEYARPAAEHNPTRDGMSYVADEDCPPWRSIGLLRFAQQLELDNIPDTAGDDG